MWQYLQEDYIEPGTGWWGFVYIITNTLNNRKYIGKKQFYFRKIKTVKGKRKHFLQESDWKDYWGSSETLCADIEKYGQENFRKEIIHLCKNKTECSFWEAKYQFQHDVLLDPEGFYNEWICVRVRRKQLISKKS